MRDLTPQSPAQGLVPLSIGSVSLSEAELGAITLLTPWRGQDDAAAAALKAAHGMAMPAAGRATGKEGARAIWFGKDQIMLAGPEPDARLAAHCALVDQSDAWACLRLEGDAVEAVMARLVAVDLRQRHFKRGHAIRSDLGHMPCSVTRVGDKAMLIMVFRSMAKSAVHELRNAMEAVAARG